MKVIIVAILALRFLIKLRFARQHFNSYESEYIQQVDEKQITLQVKHVWKISRIQDFDGIYKVLNVKHTI